MTREEAIARAHKLLAFTPERGASLQEVETAGRQLERLMRKWSIEQAELERAGHEAEEMAVVTVYEAREYWPEWCLYLASEVAEHFGCRAAVPVQGMGGLRFAGRFVAAQVSAYTFAAVQVQIESMGDDNSFAFGAVFGFCQSLRGERLREDEPEQCTALACMHVADADRYLMTQHDFDMGDPVEVRRVPVDRENFVAGSVAGAEMTVNPGLAGGSEE